MGAGLFFRRRLALKIMWQLKILLEAVLLFVDDVRCSSA